MLWDPYCVSLHSKEGKSHKIMRKYILERCSGAGLRSTLRPTEVMATEGMPRTLSRFMVNIPCMEISPNLNGFPQRCLRHKKQFFLISSWNCAYDSTFSLSITEQCLPSNPLLNRNSNTYLPPSFLPMEQSLLLQHCLGTSGTKPPGMPSPAHQYSE